MITETESSLSFDISKYARYFYIKYIWKSYRKNPSKEWIFAEINFKKKAEMILPFQIKFDRAVGSLEMQYCHKDNKKSHMHLLYIHACAISKYLYVWFFNKEYGFISPDVLRSRKSKTPPALNQILTLPQLTFSRNFCASRSLLTSSICAPSFCSFCSKCS